MNKELEQLVEYAITDGYITDKERQVLIKKAEKLGYDVDELEMILDGKLGNFRRENIVESKVRKCPSCGEVLKGFSRVCDACDYIIDEPGESFYEESSISEVIDELRKNITSLKHYGNVKGGDIGNIIFLIIITGGLHLVYRIVTGKALFAKEDEDYTDDVNEITEVIAAARSQYGKNPEILKILDDFSRETDEIIQRRRANALQRGLITFAIVAAVIILPIVLIPMIPEGEPSAADRVEEYIEQGNIGKAKAWLPQVTSSYKKDKFGSQLEEMEMDSILKEAKDYDAALKIVNLESSTYDRERKIDDILEMQVDELITAKEYKKARERAKMASYTRQASLESKVDLAETLNK